MRSASWNGLKTPTHNYNYYTSTTIQLQLDLLQLRNTVLVISNQILNTNTIIKSMSFTLCNSVTGKKLVYEGNKNVIVGSISSGSFSDTG
jgi:hypothetical protein